MSSRSEPVQLQDLWGQDAVQAMQPRCEAELPSVTPALTPRDELPTTGPWRRLFLAEEFQPGQAEDEKLQVRVFVWCHLHLRMSGGSFPPDPSSPVTHLSCPQLTVRVEVEEVSSDKMQPPGALLEPGGSWVQQPKARGEDRPLEEAGDRETPGPEDELPHVAKEEPPPNPEPGPHQPF